MTATCVRCGRPMADTAYVDTPCAQELAQALTTAAGHAEDAEAVIARQARFGTGSRGGSGDRLPDLTRSAEFDRIAGTVGTWGRAVTEDTRRRPHWRPLAGPLCPPTGQRCEHWSCEAVRRREAPPALALELAWLAGQTGWLRKHPAAGEAFADLHAACDDLARLIDRPPVDELVGMCDCGKVLYAAHGKTVVRCPVTTCKLRWNVATSRDILRRALDDKLVTAADAARLGQYLDSDRTQEQIRKLINAWSSRALIMAHGEIDAEPVFRFGDISGRLAATPRRTPRGVAA